MWHPCWVTVLLSLLGLLGFTGVLLMTVYSPAVSSAWGSVWYIETQLDGGWFIRGLHRLSSDALIVVAVGYLAFLLVTRLHRTPHHARWWVGLALLFGAMAAALSGYLLPWDQHGYWGMTVRLNILARTPLIGDQLRSLLIGGAEPGALTLTRFYTVHVLLLPSALAWVVVWWVRRERRARRTSVECQSVTPSDARAPRGLSVEARAPSTASHGDAAPVVLDAPAVRLRGAISWLVVFGAIAAATWFSHSISGASSLTAPANTTTSDYPARPEWFNLFLFQWLKAFHDPRAEMIGSVIVPGIVLGVLALIPWIDRGSRWRIDRYFAVGFCGILLGGSAWLTIAALWDDASPNAAIVGDANQRRAAHEPLTATQEAALRAEAFNRQRERASARARRAIELANEQGIPPEGPLALLANDPLTRGPELFAAHCASCHRFDGHNGLGETPSEPATSSELAGFASRTWIRTLLANPMSPDHFGLMKKPDGEPAHTRMTKWLAETRTGLPDDAARDAFESNLDAAAAYLESESNAPGRYAEASRTSPNSTGATTGAASPDKSPDRDGASTALIRKGRTFFMSTCNECHSYRGERSGTFSAPEMFGYGSVDWIERMIRDPSDDSLYRSKGREPAQMPAFRDRLTEPERRLIAEWLHQSQRADDRARLANP